jgi:TolA-binding protein
MTHAQVDGGGGNYNDSFTSTGSGSGNNDPIRGVLWTTHRHGGRDASLSMVSVQNEPNWMLDGAGSEFDEDSERPMPGAPAPPPSSNKDEKVGSALSSLFSSTTLSRTRRAPRRTVSGDSALSLESFESFYSYGSNDRSNIPQQLQQQDDERPLPFTVTATSTTEATSKDAAAPSETGSPSGRRGGKRRDYQLRVISSQGSTLVTNRDNSVNENDADKAADNGGDAPSSGGKEGVDNDGAPMLRRIFRTFSWDGYDPNNLRGGGANAAAYKPSDSSEAGTSPLTNSSTEDSWRDDRERMLAEIQLLRTQLEERQSLLDKFEKNPALVGTLEQQVRSAAEEHVQLTDLVKELQKQIQSKDQELTAMRLESLSRGGFGSGASHLSEGGSAETNNGAHVPSADSIGLCTSSRWDSPEVRGGSAVASSTVVVSADEYKALQTASDTAMMRAGELAHQLALARGDVDDLRERLNLTTERFQTSILESVELKALNDAIQAKVEWLEQQHQQHIADGRTVSGSASSPSANGVPRTPSSRLGQLLQRSPAKVSSRIAPAASTSASSQASPGGWSSFLASNPLQRLQMLTGAPASPAALAPESPTVASSAADEAGMGENGAGPTNNGESNLADNEALARELARLKLQVSQLQDEKAECLASLVEAHTQLAGLQQGEDQERLSSTAEEADSVH